MKYQIWIKSNSPFSYSNPVTWQRYFIKKKTTNILKVKNAALAKSLYFKDFLESDNFLKLFFSAFKI